MKKKKIKAKFGTQRAYEDLRGEPAGKKGMMEALRQGVENGEDAILEKFDDRTAGEINIILSRKNGAARILDNGRGFGDEEIGGFFSWYESPKRGKGGRTIGQHGSGRVFLLCYCKMIRVFSVSEQYPEGIMLELTEEQLRELFDNKELDGDYYVDVELPDWWHLPQGTTGSGVELIDVDWKRVPQPREVIDTFATYFRPSITRKIKVNGCPLKPLQMVGEPVQQTFQIEGLGEIEVELYVPLKHERWHAVRLGAHNPVYSLRDFADGLDPTLEAMIPNMLFHSIAGDIFVPSLNPHVAPDRKSFRDSLYGGPHTFLVAFLSEELEPILTEAYARKEREEKRRRDAEMCRTVCRAINEAFEFDPRELKKLRDEGDGANLPEGTKTPTAGLEEGEIPVAIKRYREVMVGDHTTFRIPYLEGVRDEDVEWDDAHSGGFLNTNEGPKVLYTAGEVPGKGYKLLAKDKKSNREILEVTIAIVVSRDLRISPSKSDVEQGRNLKLRVRNYQGTSGKIGWKMQRQRGVRLLDREGLQTELQVADDAPLVKVVITAYDLEDPSKEAVAEVQVIVGDKGNYLKLRDCQGNDHHFEFKRATFHQSQMVVLSMHSRIATSPGHGSTVGRVVANFDHPDFQHLKDIDSHADEGKESWMQMLLASILLSFLDEQVRLGILDPADYNAQFHELRNEVMRARAQKKKKK